MAFQVSCGQKLVFGVREPLPITNAPDGRIRLRLRNDSYGKMFVRDRDGIREFAIGDFGNHWEPVYEQRRNIRKATQ